MASTDKMPEDDPMRCKVSMTLKGMAGYRVKQYAKNKNISESLAATLIILEGLKGLGLVSDEYDVSKMRRGI